VNGVDLPPSLSCLRGYAQDVPVKYARPPRLSEQWNGVRLCQVIDKEGAEIGDS